MKCFLSIIGNSCQIIGTFCTIFTFCQISGTFYTEFLILSLFSYDAKYDRNVTDLSNKIFSKQICSALLI